MFVELTILVTALIVTMVVMMWLDHRVFTPRINALQVELGDLPLRSSLYANITSVFMFFVNLTVIMWTVTYVYFEMQIRVAFGITAVLCGIFLSTQFWP